MHPLRERTGPTFALEADAIDLLRAALPHEVPPGQKQRVRARLLEQRVTRRARMFRPMVLAMAIVLLAAAASAAVGRRWIERTVETLLASSAQPKLASSALSGRSARSVRSRPSTFDTSNARGVASVEAIPPSDAPVGAGIPATPDPKRSLRAKRPHIAMHSAIPVAAEKVSTPSGAAPGNHSAAARQMDGTGLVFDGMRALRQEDRPSRASRLLAEYLRAYPGGALAEEALALSIEAAAMRGDPRGEELARQYFARYPSGHFRAAVETARARLSR